MPLPDAVAREALIEDKMTGGEVRVNMSEGERA